jgi:hypothetical protein
LGQALRLVERNDLRLVGILRLRSMDKKIVAALKDETASLGPRVLDGDA